MLTERKWMIPVFMLLFFILIFWGVYGEGTAKKLFPEVKPEETVVAQEEISEDKGPVMKYDAATHRRAYPMRDPFHMDAIMVAKKAGEGTKGESVHPSSAPSLKSGKQGKYPVSHDPSLKGIMSTGERDGQSLKSMEVQKL